MPGATQPGPSTYFPTKYYASFDFFHSTAGDDRTRWRKLFRTFSNLKTIRIDDGLIKELSRCVRLDDGERHLELLPSCRSSLMSDLLPLPLNRTLSRNARLVTGALFLEQGLPYRRCNHSIH